MRRTLTTLIALALALPAFAQIAPPTAPTVTVAAKDYGASSACDWVPPTGAYGNFRAIRALDCVLIKSDAAGPRTLADIIIDKSRDGVTNYVSSRSAIVSGMVIERFDITARKRGIHLRGPSSGVIVRDGTLRGQGVNTDDGDIPEGMLIGKSGGLDGTGPRDVLIERVVSRDHLASYAGYPNADGFASERDVTGLTFRDTSSFDNTDGCYDVKSVNTLFDRTYAARCRYGYRLWGSGRATYIIAENNKAAIQMAASSTNYVIEYLDVRGTGADVQVNVAGGKLAIKACSAPVRVTGSASAIAKTTVTLGPGCHQGEPPAPLPAFMRPEVTGLCAFATKLPDNNGDGKIDLGAANRKLCGNAPRVQLKGQNRVGQFVYDRA